MLKVKKSQINKVLLKLLMCILLLLQKMLKDINDDDNSVDNHTHYMEQALNKPYPRMECKCMSTKGTE